MKMFLRRLRNSLAVFALFLATISTAYGQLWINYSNSNWNNAANWSPNGVPISSPTTALTFSTVPQILPPLALNYQPVGNYTVTHDIAGTFNLNSLTFNGFGACEVTSNGIVVTSSTGGLNFTGTNPSIIQNGTGSVGLLDGTAFNDITINNSLAITGAGTGHIFITSTITGSGSLNINHMGAAPMFTGGNVTFAPQINPNTFAGTINLNAGNLSLGATNSPLGLATNQLVISGGSIRGHNNAVTIPNSILLNSALNIVGTQNLTFINLINGNGGINVRSTGVAEFQNAIGTTGILSVSAVGFGTPALNLSSSGSSNGTALNASQYSIVSGALNLSNSTQSVQRLNPMGTLNLFNSQFSFAGGSTIPSNEIVANTNIQGGVEFVLTPGTTSALVFTGGNLLRPGNATFTAAVTGVGRTLGGPVGTAGNANLIFTNLDSNVNIGGVLPFATARIQIGTAITTVPVGYDLASGVVPINPALEFSTVHPHLAGDDPSVNYRLPANSNSFGGFVGMKRFNSLYMETNPSVTTGAALYGTSVLTLTSGVIISALTNGITQPSVLPAALTSDIEFPVTGYVHASANLVLLGSLSGGNGVVFNGGLAPGGGGTIRIAGENSDLTGGIVINSGSVLFSRNISLGAVSEGLTLGSGSNTSGALNFFPSNQFEPTDSPSVTVNRPVTLQPGGGTLVTTFQNNSFTLSGVISGGGRLIKSGFGVLRLTGANTYTGDTLVTAGTLVVNNDSNLGGPASNIVLGSSSSGITLLFTSSFTSSNRNILLSNNLTTPTLFTNTGSVVTLNGAIGGNVAGTSLTKSGEGTLILTANNTFNSVFTMGESLLSRRPGVAFAQPAGTVILSGANGSLSAATGFGLGMGATLHLDNSSVVNANRLASREVTLIGGTLKMTGNASVNTFEHIGQQNTLGLRNSSLGNVITLEQPGSGGLGLKTTLIAIGYSTSIAPSTGIAFFRGTNLGAAAGDRTELIFVAAPTLTNGIIPQAFYADSPTADPQDFATTATTGVGTAVSVVRFNSYTALPTGGGVNTTNYSVTNSTQTLIAPSSVNGLKLANGSVNLNGNNMNFNNAGLLLSTGLADAFTTTSGTPTLTFTLPARVSVATSLSIGNATNPVSLQVLGGLHKFGSGKLSITTSLFAASYEISQGTLTMLTTSSYSSGIVTILPGATLDTSNLGTAAAPFGIFRFEGFGTVKLGSGAIAVGSGISTFGGSLEGTGTFLVTGVNGQTLNGNSPNFSGGVRVLNGSATSATAGLVIDANVVPTDNISPGPLGTGITPILLGATSGTSEANIAFTANVTRFERDITVQGGGTGVVGLTGVSSTITTISSNITTNIARTLRLALGTFGTGNGSHTFTGAIGGNGAVQIFGGQMAFWGNNTYSGGTLIEVDTAGNAPLGVGHNNAFGTGTVRYAVNSPMTAALRADNGDRIIANNMTIENAGANIVIGYAGQNSFRFTGTFDLNTTPTSGLTRTFNVATRNVAEVLFEGEILDSGGSTALNKTGTGTLVLSGQNTYSGGTTLTAGVLALGSSSVGAVITSGPIGTGGFVINGGTLRAVGGAQTVNNPVTISANYAVDGMEDISMGGATSVGAAIRTIVITNTGATTFSGVISSGPGGGLVMEGTGTLILSGTNTYTGSTTVNGGKLRVNNSSGSGTGPGSVMITDDGTLEGTGEIQGDIGVATGGLLGGGESNSPSVGKLRQTSGTLTLASGSTLVVGVHSGTTASGPNLGASSVNDASNNYFEKTGLGAATIDPNILVFVDATNVSSFDFLGSGYSYKIGEISGLTSSVTIPNGNVTMLFANGMDSNSRSVFFDSTTGSVYLNFTPIPEPAWLMGLAMNGLLVMRCFVNPTRKRG